MPEQITIELPSDPQWLRMMRGTVEKWCLLSGFTEDEARPVMLAVDEALANIMRHAYADRAGEAIHASFSRDERGLTFLLEDCGAPVDRSRICKQPPEELVPGGRGTHFIREIMDEMDYETLPSRNRVRLVKYRPRKAAGG